MSFLTKKPKVPTGIPVYRGKANGDQVGLLTSSDLSNKKHLLMNIYLDDPNLLDYERDDKDK